MKIDLEEQVNLDREYVKDKLEVLSEILDVDEEYLHFKYKEEEFYLFYNVKNIPTICILTENVKLYPHFLLLEDIKIGERQFYALCLYTKGEILFHNLSYREKVDFILEQFERLLNLNPFEQEREIIKEYRYHWNKIADIEVFSEVSPFENVKETYLYEYRNKNCDKEKRKYPKKYLIANKFPLDMNVYSYTRMNCLYVDLLDLKSILPPPFKEWNSRLLKEIMFSLNRERIDKKTNQLLSNYYVKDYLFVFFRLSQLDNNEIGIKIKFLSSEKKKLLEKLDQIECINFVSVVNRNMDSSIKRNGGIPVTPKKVLLIGCGSLGSYIARELPKIGVKDLTIVDSEDLEFDNLSRHALGEYFVGKNKAKSMCEWLDFEYHDLTITPKNTYLKENNIDEIINEDSDYDLVIITTGNEDLQYMLNKQILGISTFIPTVYCWLESQSVGAHALVMKNNLSGCYNCVLNSDYRYIKNTYDQIKHNGCGGAYSPYGVNILLSSTTMILDIINSIDNIESNALYSFKNQIEQNKIENVFFTDNYYQDHYGINIKTNIKDESCDICE